MAQGLERRAQPVDNLRGAEAVEPVTRSVPSVGAPPTPRVPVDTFGAKIAQQVNQFAQGRLAEVQQKRQEKSMMEGQIAAMQGQSFESVEMEGDKWALEGYRLVTAQTMSASLLRAQEAEIERGGYEQDPDQYRATLVNRIDGMVSEIPDERTRELARESLMAQAPTLIDAHMRQNIGFREQQNFDALAGSVDTLSRDNSSTGALIAFATGESEATAGLSQERRRAAVVQGVVNAFENNNPAAFAHLEAAEFFNTDNLTASQLRTVRSAQAAYHSRMEGEWNADWHKEDRRIKEAVQSGNLDPLVAVEQFAANNATHQRRTTASSAGQIYDAARAGVEFNEGTRGLNIQAAGASGDYDLQARLMQDAVIHQESRGNPNAVSPVGAVGIMQLMPGTAMNPGFGVRNIFQVARDMGVPVMGETEGVAQTLMRNPEVNKAMGTEYLSTMLRRYNGDVPRALAAYNWGAGNADNWDGDMSKLPAETRGYIENITGAFSDNIPDPAADRLAAERNLERVRTEARLDAYEAATPQLDILDEQYRRGTLTHDDWIEQSRGVMQNWGMEVDMQRLNHEAQINRTVIRGIADRADSAAATENEIAMASELRVAQIEYEGVLEAAQNGSIGQAEVQTALQGFMQTRRDLHEKYGIPVQAGAEIGAQDNDVRGAIEAVRVGRQAAEDRAVRQRAAAMGTAGALPPEQQQTLVAENDQRLRQMYTDAVADGSLPEEVAQNMFQIDRMKFFAESGIVQPTQRRVINAGLDQNPMIDGNVNPAFSEAVEAYMTMQSVNPTVADRYIDPENRAVLDTIVSRVGTGGNVGAAIYGYANQMSRASTSPYRTPEEFVQDSGVQRRVAGAVDSYIASTDIGLFQAMFWSDADVSQVWDRRSSFDLEVHQDALRNALQQEVMEGYKHNPNLRVDDQVSMAAQRVQRRYAFAGGDLIDVGTGNDAHELFFGNRGAEMTGQQDSINAAIMHHLRSEDFRAEYPDIENSTFGEATGLAPLWNGVGAPVANFFLPQSWEFSGEGSGIGPRGAISTGTTGVRPFRVISNPQSGGRTRIAIEYSLPGGGYSQPIELDPAQVGSAYVEHIRQTNR